MILIFTVIIGGGYLLWVIRKNQCVLSNNTFLGVQETRSLRGIMAVAILLSHVSSLAIQVSENPVMEKVFFICVSRFGSMGVGAFFLISGFCNVKSLEYSKNYLSAKVSLHWIKKKFISIIVPFICCFMLTSIVLITVSSYSIQAILCDLIMIRIPFTTTWYLKIQMLYYVILIISMHYIKSDRLQCWVICGISIVVALSFLFSGSTWWQGETGLCFALGTLIAKYENKISNIIENNKKYIFVLACLGLLGGYGLVCFKPTGIFAMVLWMIVVLSLSILIHYMKIYTKILEIIGENSLVIYLIHIGLVSCCFKGKYSEIGVIKIIVGTICLCIIASYIEGKIKK